MGFANVTFGPSCAVTARLELRLSEGYLSPTSPVCTIMGLRCGVGSSPPFVGCLPLRMGAKGVALHSTHRVTPQVKEEEALRQAELESRGDGTGGAKCDIGEAHRTP